MGNITKVPNGPLIKKKGPFKGSTLKSGGVIKKAQGGTTTTQTTTPVKKTWNQMTPTERKAAQDSVRAKGGREGFSTFMDSISNSQFAEGAARKNMTVDQYRVFLKKNGKKENAKLEGMQDGSKRTKKTGSCVTGETGGGQSTKDNKRNGGPIKKAQDGESYTKDDKGYTYTKQVTRPEGKRTYQGKSTDQSTSKKIVDYKIRNNPSDSLRTVKPVVRKNGGMIKRADGSMSRRGLWDNLRSKAAQNKKTGAKPKSPTKAMLTQEKKIKAKGK